MTWIVTASGKRVDPLNIKPADIEIADICHALGNLCRFTGHSRRFYSVAEHSVRMVDWFFADADPHTRLAALLHDAAEAYISDIAKPLKARTVFTQPDGRGDEDILNPGDVETIIGASIGVHLGIRVNNAAEEIARADLAMLRIEAHALMPDCGLGWPCFKNMDPMSEQDMQRAHEIRRDAGDPGDWPRWFAMKLDEILDQLDAGKNTAHRAVAPKRRRLATGG